MDRDKYGLNGNALKIVAVIAMTVDHLTWAVFPGFSYHPAAIVLHIIGRLTCPIMCFFIAEGYHYTKNFRRYFFRLLLFALLSHVPYVLNAWNYTDRYSLIPFYNGSFLNQTGVLWAFAMGLLLIRVNESERMRVWLKILLSMLICVAAFPADWSCVATILIFLFYKTRGEFKKQAFWLLFMMTTYFIVYFFSVNKVYALIQFGTVLSLPLLYFYNGKRGKNRAVNKALKWFFYIYYPLHLTVIWAIFYYLV